MSRNLRIDAARLQDRLARMARIGALPGGGVCRLALTDQDREARLLLVAWMEELGLEVVVDAIGNITGTRAGTEPGPPVMLGSHIDTVATGGIYDGTLGVLAGLEVVATLDEAGIRTRHPIAVAAFTGEEGARFAPDMLGALVHQGALGLEEARAIVGIDGTTVGAELDRIGQAGPAPVGTERVRAFLELHIEQGPRLEAEGTVIGAVTGVQGISWAEYTIEGTSNHAGTTPMAMRHDPGLVAAALAVLVRRLAGEIEGQVGTVGRLALEPGLVNVIPARAVMTVDLRNPDEARLQAAEARLGDELARLAAAEGVTVTRRTLARFPPKLFDDALVGRVEAEARALGHSVTRMASGAGHDAQAFAPNAPTAMIFVPSRGGISHNTTEYTAPEHVEAGANVLLHTALALAMPVAGEGGA
jgi:beta-ureidopropionase / N-carbamoyl-L-amino-acid hydrolase